MPPTNKETNIFKDKSYKCVIDGCDASYRKKCMLKVHMRKHTGERPYVCNFPGCSLSYTNSAHLKRHVCVVHGKAEEVACPEQGCGLVFSNKYSLKKHQNNKHKPTGKEFYCAICHQGFKKKRQLKRHVFLHRDPNAPFKCSVCNLAFSEIHLFNKHNRNHKTFTCDCGIVFTKWSLFCEHRKTSCSIKRIDHKCIICNKVFTTKTNLKTHALTHLEESQVDIHRCPYVGCNRSYKYKKNLNAHITTFHEKCFTRVECYHCGKILKSKRILTFHLEKVHTRRQKRKSERAPRKDKGIAKKCMAAKVSGIDLPIKAHKAFIAQSDGPDTSSTSLNQENSLLHSNNPREDSVVIETRGQTLECAGLNTTSNMDFLINNKESGNIKLISVSNTDNDLNEVGESIKQCAQTDTTVTFTEQSLQSDELLLSVCDGVLKNIQIHLERLPSINSHIVV